MKRRDENPFVWVHISRRESGAMLGGCQFPGKECVGSEKGMAKSWVSNRALEEFWQGGKGWLERAWNGLAKQFAFVRLREKSKDYNFKNHKVERLLCNTRGRHGLHLILHPVSLTKIWSLQSYIINVSQMAEGLASSVLSDTYPKSVYNFLMFSGWALM